MVVTSRPGKRLQKNDGKGAGHRFREANWMVYDGTWYSLMGFSEKVDITMENHHFEWVNQLFLWPLSIASPVSLPGWVNLVG